MIWLQAASPAEKKKLASGAPTSGRGRANIQHRRERLEYRGAKKLVETFGEVSDRRFRSGRDPNGRMLLGEKGGKGLTGGREARDDRWILAVSIVLSQKGEGSEHKGTLSSSP